MAGITLAQAEAKLTLAMAAYEKALEADSYSHSDRSVSRNLDAREKAVRFWENEVQRLTRKANGGIPVRGITVSR